MEQGHWHELTSKEGGKAPYRPWSARRDAAGPRARLWKARLSRPCGPGRSRRASTWATNGPTAASSTAAPRRPHLDLRGHHAKTAFPNGLPVEMTIEVFRTYKGNIEKGVLGSLAVRNPQDRQEGRGAHSSSPRSSSSTRSSFPASCKRPKGEKVDLFKDFVRRRPGGGLAAMRASRSNTLARPRPTCTSAPATPPSR